jgi:hypothetical protein
MAEELARDGDRWRKIAEDMVVEITEDLASAGDRWR